MQNIFCKSVCFFIQDDVGGFAIFPGKFGIFPNVIKTGWFIFKIYVYDLLMDVLLQIQISCDVFWKI